MADLVLYGSPLSPFARKVEMVLGEKGLDYDFENVSIMPMPDWFAEISPARRIPVLRDKRIGTEGVPGTIPDSSAIVGYLEKLEPQPAVYPADAYEYGRALFIEEYADSVMAMLGGMGIFRAVVFPRFQGKESDLDTARTTWNEKLPPVLDYLEGTLDGKDFFVGDTLSIADIAVAAQIGQLDIVAGLPSDDRWPWLVAHYQGMTKLSGMAKNLANCAKLLAKVVPEKIDLS